MLKNQAICNSRNPDHGHFLLQWHSQDRPSVGPERQELYKFPESNGTLTTKGHQYLYTHLYPYKKFEEVRMKKLLTSIATGTALLFSLQVLAQEIPETITVTSSVFDHHGTVPEANSAYGDNQSIDLAWSDLPEGTVQLALVADDPIVVEAGMMESPFVHWVVYNIPASASGLPAGMSTDAEVMEDGLDGTINGLNGLGNPGYFGPRPPANGRLHAYHFRVYAVDADLGLEAGLNKEQLLEAIDGHVLATGMLMGHYERKE